jgi:hypothetical protein
MLELGSPGKPHFGVGSEEGRGIRQRREHTLLVTKPSDVRYAYHDFRLPSEARDLVATIEYARLCITA